jgi:hypothetical protein
MAPHLSSAEQGLVLKLVSKAGNTPADAVREVNKRRAKQGTPPVAKTTVYRYTKGDTHRPMQKEKRGRPKALSRLDIRKLDQSRRRLIKKAKNEHPVTYKEIAEEAGLHEKAGERTVADGLRGINVRFRAPRSKVFLSEPDAMERLKVAKAWIKHPASHWAKNIHAYMDCKSFPLPLNAKQRSKIRQARVKGHLRKPSEGTSRGFTKVRTKHSFLGVPSVTIAAAVAKDKVIMWHVVSGTWNGAAAASMYEALKKALVKCWGKRRTFTIVEDGDRKGNQSGKGLKAKDKVDIKSKTFPPRTPSWMPLDYSIWSEIDKKMDEAAPTGDEAKAAFMERLEKCAKKLPRTYIRKVLARMKKNIQGVIDARGVHAKND